MRNKIILVVWTSVFALVLAGAKCKNNPASGSSVEPLYPGFGGNWNDYVKNDGLDTTTATDVACEAGVDGPHYDACLHGGELRSLLIEGLGSCDTLSASDLIGAFTWVCVPEPDNSLSGDVRIISTGFQTGKGLKDLIDFDRSAWFANRVSVSDGAKVVAESRIEAWWTNPIVRSTDTTLGTDAGTVYIVSTSAPGFIALSADKTALVVQPGVTLSPIAGQSSVVTVAGQDFVWIEGTIDASGTNGVRASSTSFSVFGAEIQNATGTSGRGLECTDCTTSLFFDLSVSGSTLDGVRINGGAGNVLRDVTVSDNQDGLVFVNTTTNRMDRVDADDNTRYGIHFQNASDIRGDALFVSGNQTAGIRFDSTDTVTLSNIVAADNVSGVAMTANSTLNRLYDVVANNNDGGVQLVNVENNFIHGLTAFGNALSGLSIDGGRNNVVKNVTATNNGATSMALRNTSGNHVSNVATTNNTGDGLLVEGVGTADNTISNVAALHNGNSGINYATGANNYFTGLLLAGDNGVQDCLRGGVGLGVDNGCLASGTSDFVFTGGLDATTAFTAKLTGDDATNGSGQSGNGTVPFDQVTDWTHFEPGFLRGWGKDGGAFPDAAQRGRCVLADGTCRLWQWGLNAGGGAPLLGAVGVLPSGVDIVEHIWDAVDLTDCEQSVVSGEWYMPAAGGAYCRTIELRDAVELLDDGVGNDDGVCTSGETCQFTRNIGSYQGHGTLESAGTFTDGVLTGINLVRPANNGR